MFSAKFRLWKMFAKNLELSKFEILRLQRLKFQIPTAWSLSFINQQIFLQMKFLVLYSWCFCLFSGFTSAWWRPQFWYSVFATYWQTSVYPSLRAARSLSRTLAIFSTKIDKCLPRNLFKNSYFKKFFVRFSYLW